MAMSRAEAVKKLKKFKRGEGIISWLFGNERYYGKKLSETADEIKALTTNGKIKTIKKNK
jgi:hypothetical protein